jgi:hypothetical protein
MKHSLFSFAIWFVSNPRRTFTILFVILMVLALATAVVPNGVAIAGDITSGS